jgi:pSer/pThr/pTyr-binding forkhead associated (FHA) protein
MPVRLVSLDDGPSIVLDKPILLLGRHPECDVQIDSRKISRRHCCIAQVNNTVVIRDLGSTNGIKINGIRVHEARLQAGDEVTIGSHRYRVANDSLPVMPNPPSPAQPVRSRQSDKTVDEDALLEASEVPIPLDDPSRVSGDQPQKPIPPVASDHDSQTQGADDVVNRPEVAGPASSGDFGSSL